MPDASPHSARVSDKPHAACAVLPAPWELGGRLLAQKSRVQHRTCTASNPEDSRPHQRAAIALEVPALPAAPVLRKVLRWTAGKDQNPGGGDSMQFTPLYGFCSE